MVIYQYSMDGYKINNNVDIFVETHKNFNCPVTNGIYKIIKNYDVEITNTNLQILSDDSGDNIHGRDDNFSEMTMHYWLWKNYDIKDYIGICHYRRYFDFMDDVPNFDELFKDYDIILPKQIKSPFTNAQQYAMYHNIFDLEVISMIIKDLFPKYYDSHIETLCNKCSMHPCNMFITKKETFNDMMNFVFTICFEFENRMNLHNSNDYINHINKNKSLYLKDFYPNNTVQYQARILGFISERLLEIYYNYNNLKIKEYDVNETEMKYGTNLYKPKN